jgi:hypothetical protein
MHMTAYYMPSMHHMSAFRIPPTLCAGRGMLDTDIRYRHQWAK